ncbi:hypothetical protein XELAEV_18001832mg [Xenopus laevis]|nr:hypothetical protein XELAEV_18001832mg [Xenopus laevis]
MHTTTCTQLYAHNYMHTITHTQLHAHNCMHTTISTQLYAHNYMQTTVCTQSHTHNHMLKYTHTFTPTKGRNNCDNLSLLCCVTQKHTYSHCHTLIWIYTHSDSFTMKNTTNKIAVPQ